MRRAPQNSIIAAMSRTEPGSRTAPGTRCTIWPKSSWNEVSSAESSKSRPSRFGTWSKRCPLVMSVAHALVALSNPVTSTPIPTAPPPTARTKPRRLRSLRPSPATIRALLFPSGSLLIVNTRRRHTTRGFPMAVQRLVAPAQRDLLWLDRETAQARAYDEIGARYDEAFPHKEGQLACAERLLERLEPGARVLDLGAGTGLPTARQLIAAGCQVTCLDLAPGMLELAQANVPGARFIL